MKKAEIQVLVPASIFQAALNYIRHVGANHVMRGEPHPQQGIVDGLEMSAANQPESAPTEVEHKWIPVTERVPPWREQVLFAHKYYTEALFGNRSDDKAGGQWRTPGITPHEGYEYQWKDGYITDWMPLPNIPSTQREYQPEPAAKYCQHGLDGTDDK